jgi:hypothetical protein
VRDPKVRALPLAAARQNLHKRTEFFFGGWLILKAYKKVMEISSSLREKKTLAFNIEER